MVQGLLNLSNMLSTDFAALFKHVTGSISDYVMFLVFLFVLYLFVSIFIKLITESIISIVIAIRAPITSSLEDFKEE